MMTEWGNFDIILIVCKKMPSGHNKIDYGVLKRMSDETKVNKNRAKKKIKAKKRKGAFLKILPVLIAVLLIIIVIGAFYGQKILEKRAYGTERADLNEYFGIQSGKLALVFNAQKSEEKVKLIDGTPYFTEDFVRANLTDHFYVSREENSVLYTTDKETIECVIGKDFKYYLTKDSQVDLDYLPVVLDGETLYFAVDFVKLFVPLQYDIYADPGYMVAYTENPEATVAKMNKKSAVRSLGGIKSPILDDLEEGETVYVLEEMEDWAKVIDTRGFIGYVEIKQYDVVDSPVQILTDTEVAIPLNYQEIVFEGKINMAFHQVFVDPASHFAEDTAQVKSVNVIAPTLFRIDANEDSLVKALPGQQYAQKAHDAGMKVWGVWTDVDSKDLDINALLNSSVKRRKLVETMISLTKENNLDGINIDIETVSEEGKNSFTQFLRELSIRTHEEGIILSVDNYAIRSFHPQYDIAEEGKVVDYVCLMGYDEHQKDVGSNASINFVERGIRENTQDIPAKKIINIVPFYTRLWRITDENTFGCDIITMKTQAQWLTDVNLTTAWDNETCQNYGETVVGGKTCRLWLEDAESLEVKLNVMDTYELAGVGSWKLGFETPDVWDVFEKYMAGTLNPEAKQQTTAGE